MTKEQRKQSLTAARRAYEWLRTYFNSFHHEPFEHEVTCLMKGFKLLDDKEQKQVRAGSLGAKHGKKGGRPKTNPSPH